ncbi:MAG: dual specificity protein phosphatase family protein [Planctomycetaceae bacterium]|nr:dual specificity protein phosphatase family protein [Planctomycetaceae bacterium]
MSKLHKRLVLLYAILIVSGLASTGIGKVKIDSEKTKKYQTQRPANWAVAIKEDGLPNFHKVSETLYRGAQPDANGIAKLKAMGIKTILNLRAFHSDKDEIGDVNIGCEHISMTAWHPEYKEIVKFLQIVTDPNKTPVFVHCQHGADRTGLMCAVYRAAVEGWSKEDALNEMIYGGYGFHSIWKNLLNYYMRLDIEKLKQQINPNSPEPVKNPL